MAQDPDSVAKTLRETAGTQRVPSERVDLFIKRAFLSPKECEELIELIDAGRRPSTLADHFGDAPYRTSESCDLNSCNPGVLQAEARIAEITGLDPACGEPLQGQRYAVGQEFKAHTDYFEPNGIDYARYCSQSGQRTWTVMIYLNQPGAGGATRFKTINKIIQPETGKLLAWNNLARGGGVNPDTLHQGMKVRQGTKYIITKWYRQRPWLEASRS